MAENKTKIAALKTKNDVLKESRDAVAAHEVKLSKPLAAWTFAEFFTLTVPKMKAFMKARTPGIVMPYKGSIKKGTVDADPDAQTLARIAFRMRDKKPVAEELTLQDLGMQLTDENKERTLVMLPAIVDVGQFRGPLEHLATLPDDKIYSDDAEWMDAVAKLLIGYQAGHVARHPAIDLRIDVEAIAKALSERLQLHLRQRLFGCLTALRSHWVWRFYATNIPRMAAIVVWFGHTVRGCQIRSHVAAKQPLLYNGPSLASRFLPETQPRVCNRVSRVQSRRWDENTCGAYVHRDSILNLWVRSGKVARRGGHAARQREHEKAASKPIGANTASFYRAYNMNAGATRGNFKDLRCYFAMGFDKKDWKEVADLFDWSNGFKSRCKTASWQTFQVAVACMHAGSCMFELTYDFLLAKIPGVMRACCFIHVRTYLRFVVVSKRHFDCTLFRGFFGADVHHVHSVKTQLRISLVYISNS